ncbi:MAG TPA: hypothetical protein H9870_11955 [Candidatus Corynebacterium avicola]|uniref:Glyoxalase-like domain-containing protein n=1 Tax=Candidatus Corynebacterium avicola TaxID=2838527 RepID=A0A9D1RT89_9CORY|nr:hypothetical protein [Candidatus Corynebacterium avicola]
MLIREGRLHHSKGLDPGSLLLALTSHDIERDVEDALALGATTEGIQNQDGFVWADMNDPEGNQFTFNAPAPG